MVVVLPVFIVSFTSHIPGGAISSIQVYKDFQCQCHVKYKTTGDVSDEKYLFPATDYQSQNSSTPEFRQKRSKREGNTEFEPSLKILLRIMKALLETNPIGKTALSASANVNYNVLSQYLLWLEKKSMVVLVLNEGKAHISMTSKGREFAVELNNLDFQFSSLIDKISI